MRIKQIEIDSFRGIPNKLTIALPVKNNRPTSLIILGDNGVGKSSIIDSIEYCLQGHFLQTKSINLTNIPSIMSLKNNNLPNITITLENDEIINRMIIDDEQGLLSSNKNPHRLYSISPFVLRRHDILRFINSSEAERTLVFSNYLKDESNTDWIEHPTEELIRLQNERLINKNKRDLLINKLAKELNISADNIPFDKINFNLFVHETIYKGFSKTQIEQCDFKIKINKKAIQLADESYREIENYRQIKKKINDFSITAHVEKFPKHLLKQLEAFLSKVSEKLTFSFLKISSLPYLDKIEIKHENRNNLAIAIELILKNGKSCTPNQLLSEANLDLLALLFYLSFIQESSERGQAKFIILDDVLQSVDSTIRVNFITYLLKNFSDWQFIITAHDRLWHRQLQELMNLHSHSYSNIFIAGWTFENGPEIKNLIINNEDSLKSALIEKNLLYIASSSGLLLEEISDALSKTLNSSIHRKKDDKYTLADLLPGIIKLLKKCSELKEIVENVEKRIHLRNLIGAHYNEWAFSLSLEEAEQFGKSVIYLFDKVKCKKCSSWIANHPELNFYSCKCGSIQVLKK